MLQICCKNNNISKNFPIGSSLLDIYNGFNLDIPYGPVSAKVNNKVEGLNYRDLNPGPLPYQGSALPLSYNSRETGVVGKDGFEPPKA